MTELLVCNVENSLCEIGNWPLYMGGKEKPKKGRPLRLVDDSFNKQESFPGLFWAVSRQADLHTCPSESYKLIYRPSPGVVTCTFRMVSEAPYSLKNTSLEQLVVHVWVGRWSFTFQGQEKGEEPLTG